MQQIIPPYNENEEIEIIYNFHNCQIWRVNTTNTDSFIKKGIEFNSNISNHIKENELGRLIYVMDKFPPLSAMLHIIDKGGFTLDRAIIAVIIDSHSDIFKKLTPIIEYAMGLLKSKNQYVIGVFNSTHRNNIKEIIDWMNTKELKEGEKFRNKIEWID